MEKIESNTVEPGCVYHVRLTQKHSINTQDKEYRNKFVVIIGCDNNAFYGVLLVNTKPGFPEEEQYELKCASYKYLNHNSFVNCSAIKHIDRETIISGTNKGQLHSDDFQLIIDCATNSKVIPNKHKKKYGLI